MFSLVPGFYLTVGGYDGVAAGGVVVVAVAVGVVVVAVAVAVGVAVVVAAAASVGTGTAVTALESCSAGTAVPLM